MSRSVELSEEASSGLRPVEWGDGRSLQVWFVREAAAGETGGEKGVFPETPSWPCVVVEHVCSRIRIEHLIQCNALIIVRAAVCDEPISLNREAE